MNHAIYPLSTARNTKFSTVFVVGFEKNIPRGTYTYIFHLYMHITYNAASIYQSEIYYELIYFGGGCKM